MKGFQAWPGKVCTGVLSDTIQPPHLSTASFGVGFSFGLISVFKIVAKLCVVAAHRSRLTFGSENQIRPKGKYFKEKVMR